MASIKCPPGVVLSLHSVSQSVFNGLQGSTTEGVQSGVVSFQLFEDACKDRVSTQQMDSNLSR